MSHLGLHLDQQSPVRSQMLPVMALADCCHQGYVHRQGTQHAVPAGCRHPHPLRRLPASSLANRPSACVGRPGRRLRPRFPGSGCTCPQSVEPEDGGGGNAAGPEQPPQLSDVMQRWARGLRQLRILRVHLWGAPSTAPLSFALLSTPCSLTELVVESEPALLLVPQGRKVFLAPRRRRELPHTLLRFHWKLRSPANGGGELSALPVPNVPGLQRWTLDTGPCRMGSDTLRPLVRALVREAGWPPASLRTAPPISLPVAVHWPQRSRQ